MKINYLTILSTLLFFSCANTNNQEIKPIRKDISEIVFASGSLESDNKYNLTAQTDGNIIKLNLVEGATVAVNQLVAVIDNKQNIISTNNAAEQLKIAQYNNTDNAPLLQQIKANIEAAKEKLSQDITQEQRYQELYNQSSVTKSELEKMQLSTKTSKANLAALEQQYKSVQQQNKQQYITQSNAVKGSVINQENNQVKIVAAGKVYKKVKQVGDYVRRGDVIAIIANENLLYAKLNVDENSIDKVKVGQTITIQLNTQKNKKYTGVVSEILPVFDEPSQSFIVKVQFTEKPDFTVNGTQLEANILVGEKKNTLLIPRNYVSFGNKVQLKGSDDLKTIETGIVSTEYVEVLNGLTENDILVPVKPKK
ncbi:MAG: HlyD family efflux transporter periplasmic adaptor subunit [Sphingobacteriales bacterium]|nr:HlyD family efflux transporter periplasmic adaptor subunit [Sphingobacteriales bacterium]